MGTIEIVAKYDLVNKRWNFHPSIMDYGRSFAFANYGEIINNEKGKIDYIIINHGSRVEDHSKDFQYIKEKEVRVDHVIDHLCSCQ